MIDLTRLALLGRSLRSPTPQARAANGPLLGHADGGVPVVWAAPTLERASHGVVLAASGAGKTVMVANALVQEITAHAPESADAPALLVVDAKGDLVEHVISGLAATAPERLAAVRYLDPFAPTGGFAFNLNRLTLGQTPLDIRGLQLANLVADVSTATGRQAHLGTGARQLDVLYHLVLGALASDDARANVLWALDALTSPRGLLQLASVTRSERARSFLASAQLSDELRASCASRLRSALAASDTLERMVAASGCIDFAELLAPGRLTLVDLGRPIGGLATLQAFYANLLCRLAIEHLMERPSPFRGHHCGVVIDEAQVVAPVLSDRAEAILTTGRSRGLSLTTISQGTTLIDAASDTLLRVLMTNTPTKIIGRLAAPDAELLSREQAPSRGVDERLSSMRGRFAALVTNLADREFLCLTPGGRQRFMSAGVDVAAWERARTERRDLIAAATTALQLRPDSPGRVRLADVAGAPARRAGGSSRTPPRREAGAAAPPQRSSPTPPHREQSAPSASPPSPPQPQPPRPSPPPPPRSRWG